LNFKINSYYIDFDFSSVKKWAIRGLYDDGEAKEGVGAGASLLYGILNGLTKENIIAKVEDFLKH